MTCLKIYFKPVTSSQFWRNHAQNKKFKQVMATAASQPAGQHLLEEEKRTN